MHGKSIAWVRDRCRLEGNTRSLLYAIATHADKYTGASTASSYTLARAAGCSARWVKELLPRLVDEGVLEQLEAGAGRRPACYRIAPPLWMEGTAEATDVVEGAVSVSGVVEGVVELSTGTRSGEVSSPQQSLGAPRRRRSGEVSEPVVVNSVFRSGEVPWPLSSTDGRQDKNLEERREDKNVPRPLSLSKASESAYEPPPVPESVLRELERRGLRKPKGPVEIRSTGKPPRSREEQLAALEASMAEEERAGGRPGAPSSTAPAKGGPAGSVLDGGQRVRPSTT